MTLPTISGLPALPSGVVAFNQATLLISDALTVAAALVKPQWGIFLYGLPVILADNVVTLEYKQDWRLSTYPQEQGAFATYNKVALPYEAKIRFSTGGTTIERQAFLLSIAAIADNLLIYDIVTPEQVYLHCNVVHYDYKRQASSAGLIAVDVWLEQVVINGPATFSNTTINPTSSPATNNGLVQGVPGGGSDSPTRITVSGSPNGLFQ